MKKTVLFFLLFVFNLSFAQQKYFTIDSFKLENNASIQNCKIGYRTLGKINGDSSNVILYPAWFNGVSAEIERLIRKYSFLDTTEYFIIAVDPLGNGVSTSPSNYENKLPDFTIGDMVKSQYLLLTEGMGIRRLHAIIGGSMGSFQAFQWAVDYPGFAEKIIPYVAAPRLTANEKLFMKSMLNIIDTGKKHGIPDDEIRTELESVTAMLARTSAYIYDKYAIAGFDEYWSKLISKSSNAYAIDNYRSQLTAMLPFDITKKFNRSLEETAKSIKSELFIIVSAADRLVYYKESVKLAGILNCKILKLNNKCGHLILGCQMDLVKSEINKFLEE